MLLQAYTRGMNFTDRVPLKFSNIQNNRIVFNRAKTGVGHNIGMNEKIGEVINKFQQYAPIRIAKINSLT